jgi:uncharacterized protein (DUF433 family)
MRVNMKEIAPRITVDPEVHHGSPVVKGTRVPIEIVLGQLAAGRTVDEIAIDYRIEREDVLAAIRFANDTVKSHHFRAVS